MKQLKTHDGTYINTAHIVAVYQAGTEVGADVVTSGAEYSLGEFATIEEAEVVLDMVACWLRYDGRNGAGFDVPGDVMVYRMQCGEKYGACLEIPRVVPKGWFEARQGCGTEGLTIAEMAAMAASEAENL